MVTENPSFKRLYPGIPVSHTDCITRILDDYHFPRSANRVIVVLRRVLRMWLKFSRVRGQLRSGRSSAQTTRIKVNNALLQTCLWRVMWPVLTSDTRRLPSPFMALYRTSASALELKFPAGFTLPLLACNKSGTGGLLIDEASSMMGFCRQLPSCHSKPCGLPASKIPIKTKITLDKQSITRRLLLSSLHLDEIHHEWCQIRNLSE